MLRTVGGEAVAQLSNLSYLYSQLKISILVVAAYFQTISLSFSLVLFCCCSVVVVVVVISQNYSNLARLVLVESRVFLVKQVSVKLSKHD